MAIKTAIIGYGRTGSGLHAPQLEVMDDFEVTAVCDIDPEALKKGMEYHKCAGYTDYHEMLEKADFSFVVITTRSCQHCSMTIDCLNAGKTVLVTKPWAVNAAEARSMIEAAEKSGSTLMPWLPSRWGYDLNMLQKLVAENRIGKVFRITNRVCMFCVRNDWQMYKDQGGGYLLNWGPHVVDQPMQLAGGRAKSVYAEMHHLISKGDAEDCFHSSIRMENGITINAELTIADGRHLPSWIVQGDRGTIVVKDGNIYLTTAELPSEDELDEKSCGVGVHMQRFTIEPPKGAYSYGDTATVYNHILKALKHEVPYANTLESALHLSEVLDAIRESSETDSVVRL